MATADFLFENFARTRKECCGFAHKPDSFARDDLPHRLDLVWSLGAPDLNVGKERHSNATINAPIWFKLMDRNADGDISPREFIGSRDDFRKLDLDGDGLISIAEAVRALDLRKP